MGSPNELGRRVLVLEEGIESLRRLSDERWTNRRAEFDALERRVGLGEDKFSQLLIAVRVLESKVALYAALGAVGGGVLVSIGEFLLQQVLRR